jgi:TRAP-type C4-dicarboxylate transport system permease small subunit
MRKTIYAIEETLAMVLFAGTVLLVLIGAVGRTSGMPQIWSVDLAQALFAWACVFGADIALKNRGHIVIDILVRVIPASGQMVLSYLWQIVIAVFLGILVYLGIKLTLINTQRELGDIGVSYAWVTASIPAGAALMLLTTLTRLVDFVRGLEPTTIQGHDGDAL